MTSLRLLVLAGFTLLLQDTAVTTDLVPGLATQPPISGSSSLPAIAASTFTTAVFATPASGSPSNFTVSATALPGSSIAATPPLSTPATAIPATASPPAPSPSSSVLPSASELPESTAAVTPPVPAHEDSNSTDIHNGTFLGENQDKRGILSSPAALAGVVVASVIGGLALVVAVVVVIWQLRRRQRKQASDESELIDAYVHFHTHSVMDWLTIGGHSLPHDSRNGNTEAESVQRNP